MAFVRSSSARTVAWIAVVGFTTVLAAGCRQQETRFEITSYRSGGATEYFHELFDECYYAVGRNDNVDVVARRLVRGGQGPDAPESDVIQIVHIRTVFRAVPGTTYAESSMINGVVGYAIISGAGGSCFEGAGFLSCSEDRKELMLKGALEQAKLHPNRHVGFVADIFDRAELTGAFRAKKDRKKVVAILNELNRFFGPEPYYQPPEKKADVL